MRAHPETNVLANAMGWRAIKAGCRDGDELTAAPEFEDCRVIAVGQNVPLKQVQKAAPQAFRGQAAEITPSKIKK